MSIQHKSAILSAALLACCQCLNQPQTARKWEENYKELEGKGLLRSKLARIKDEEGKEIVLTGANGKPIIQRREPTDSALYFLNTEISREDKLAAYIVAKAIYDEAFPVKPEKTSPNSDDYVCTIYQAQRRLTDEQIKAAEALAASIIGDLKIGYKPEVKAVKAKETKAKAAKPKAVKAKPTKVA